MILILWGQPLDGHSRPVWRSVATAVITEPVGTAPSRRRSTW
ncbi:hypothetical protein BC739_009067 [Kutzneria viridogrisea]|uniref:Uncharacterized protein n=1 Tax=Kutzneria viridogrisea TaxID=47990 RepID=A0ABR6BVF4_9PSEU|nr:hypothetical protein [Kutzneria viridogrisea]MBA8931808.1 hypothetical protein [Kutzneria viridogrisea]